MPKPVTVITGFLGSGKTTLLNRLLREPGLADTAVIINEFGEIAIDHLMVETAIENTVVLQNGCICCTVRGDLLDTIIDLEEKRRRELIPAFSRILIETTGLADPAPILHTLSTDPVVTQFCRLHAVVATVDAVNGLQQIARFAEPVKQVTLADAVLITKSDLTQADQIAVLKSRLEALNPGARQLEVVFGAIGADELFAHGHFQSGGGSALRRWLGAEALGPAHEVDDDPVEHVHQDGSASRHDAGIRAACLTLQEPIEWDALRQWLQSIISLRGDRVLRLKGLVNLRSMPQPVVVQGVHHLLHPPVRLTEWPDADRRSRIVVIADGLPAEALQTSLEAAAAAFPRRMDA